MSTRPRRSLRIRLTVVYAALLAVALLVYAGCVSAFFLHSLREQLDLSLDRDVEAVEGALTNNPKGQIELDSEEGEAREDRFRQGFLLEVWSSTGSLAYRSDALEGQPLGPAPAGTRGLSPEPPRSFRLSSGMRVRMLSRVHHLADGDPVLVRLAVSEEPLWNEFWEMSTALGIALPIVVLGVVVTGYLVAGRALKPVDSMARRAAEITADQLHERIEIDNPDDELGQLGMEFNTTLARLEGSFDQLRRFTADASHELRTPLTAIRSVGEVSLRKPGDEKYYRDIIGSMLEEAGRLTRLVDSLLTMSRADAGKIQLHLTAVGLVDLAKESASLLDVLAEEKQQTLRIDGDEAVAVMADRTILRQALVNLIDNAVKYSPIKGEVRIRVTDDKENAYIEVQDNGPGIPPEHRSRIFERFYRVDKARTRAEGGAGLGLSITQWAVSAHKGEIRVSCDPGPGSTFRIRLPKAVLTASELLR
jgi:heavy metal sensor kinase